MAATILDLGQHLGSSHANAPPHAGNGGTAGAP
jgi:hypothetical protein